MDSLGLNLKISSLFRPRRAEETAPTQLYASLDLSQAQLRLLRFLPYRSSSDRLRCELSIFSLEHPPEYLALSYVWGDPTPVEEIVLNDHVLPVAANLSEALRRLRGAMLHKPMPWTRRTKLPSMLWVDAICINQNDVSERNIQVRAMATIYRNADCVVAWMGPDLESTRLAMRGIRTISEGLQKELDSNPDCNRITWIKKFPELFEENTSHRARNKIWNAMRDFLLHPYWSRVWIIQEMALSRHLLLACGDTDILFEHLNYFRKWVADLQSWHFERPNFVSERVWSQMILTGPLSLRPVSLISRLRALRKSIPDAPSMSEGYELMYSTYHHAASEPLDKVYGILGLINGDIAVDYSKPVRYVYCEYVRKMHRQSGNLAFLSGAGIAADPTGEFGLPSWAPNWHRIASEKYSAYLPEIYQVSAGFGHLRPSPPEFVGSETLAVYGMCLGTVVDVEKDFSRDTLSNLCQTSDSSHASKEPWPDARNRGIEMVLRTTMMDLDPRTSTRLLRDFNTTRNKQLAASFGRILSLPRDAAAQSPSSNALGTASGQGSGSLMQNLEARLGAEGAELAEGEELQEHLATDDAVRTQLNRATRMCLFHTSTGHMGLGPHGTVFGDVVYALDQFHTLAILRPARSTPFTHAYVGEALIVGFMDGECKALLENDNCLSFQRLEIV